MGTYVLADSITGEPIKEDDKVVAILLANALSEQTASFLFAGSDDRYKLASFLIKGTWSGSCVVADDDQSLAVKSAIFATNVEAKSFEDLQRKLYTKSSVDVPNGWSNRSFYKDLPSIPVTFSLFVAKPSSIALLVESPGFVKRLDTDVATERKKVDVLFPKLLQAMEMLESEDKEVRSEGYFIMDPYLKAIFFNTTEHEIDGDSLPLTSAALASSESFRFSSRIGFFLEEKSMFRISANKMVSDTRALPAGYDEVFTAMHEAQVLAKAMQFLSVALVPAARRYSPHKDNDRIALLQTMLLDEISRLVDDVTEDRDRDDLKLMDDVLGPLRKKVSDLVKRRNDFEAKIEKSEARVRP